MPQPPEPKRSQGDDPNEEIVDETVHFPTTDEPAADLTEAFQSGGNEDARTIASAPEVMPTILTNDNVADAKTIVGQSIVPSFGDRLGTGDKAEFTGDIQKFDMIEELGSGGFGTVIRARDKQLDREVAIKIIKSASLANDPRMIKNFKSEARAAASLRHPNIVSVLQSGDDGKDQMFIVFDYIRGPTLRNIIRRKNLSVREVVQMMAKVADALGYAHSMGIVHRDVKPANILIAKESREPHIADFGCARRRQFETPSSSQSTLKHYVGTPPYFSPEQAAGHSHQADARTDVWAMGVILEETITGKRTFRYAEKSKESLFKSIRNDEPLPLRDRCGDVDRDLNAIWQCCLEKDASRRYPSGRELANDLEAWLRGDPVSVRPLGIREATARWARRNPSIAGLILAVLTAMTAGFLFSTYFYLREVKAQRDQVAAQIERLASAKADGVDEILRAISQDNLRKITFASLLDRWKSVPAQEEGTPEFHRIALALHRFTDELDNLPTLRAQIEASLLDAAQTANPRELRLMFQQHRLRLHDDSVRQLEQVASDPAAEDSRRLRAVCSLLATPRPTGGSALSQLAVKPADLAQNCVRWLQSEVVASGNMDVSDWVPLLLPLRDSLTEPLQDKMDREEGPSRRIAGAILFDFYADDPEYLRKLVLTSHDEIMPELLMRLKFSVNQPGSPPISEIKRQLHRDAIRATDPLRLAQNVARFWIAALYISSDDEAAALPLELSPTEPTPFTIFEQRAVEYGLPLQAIMARVQQQQTQDNPLVLYHLLLAMSNDEPPVVDREAISKQLARIRLSHPDSGVHGACSWLIRKWGFDRPAPNEKQDSNEVVENRTHYTPKRNWRWNLGSVYVRISEPQPVLLGCSDEEVEMYSPHTYRNQDDSEYVHLDQLPCEFEISTTEVTVAEYLEFLDWRVKRLDRQITELEQLEDSKDSKENKEKLDVLDAAWSNANTRLVKLKEMSPTIAAANLTWYDAVSYCVWRSQEENLESCYGSLRDIDRAFQDNDSPEIDLSKTGYRLPTVAEWEYACRGGTRTPWYFGLDSQFVTQYATCDRNSDNVQDTVARRMPNRFGLFDMSGNVLEWTSSAPEKYLDGKEVHVGPVRLVADKVIYREVRGGSFESSPPELRSGARGSADMREPSSTIGLRLVRTLRVFGPDERVTVAE